MEALLDEAKKCLQYGLYVPALLSYLTVPDAGGAVDFPGSKNNERYPRWFDENVSRGAGVDGNLAWALRNAVMHETKTDWRTKFGFDKVEINVPNVSNIVIQNCGGIWPDKNLTVRSIYIIELAEAIELGAKAWLSAARRDADKNERLGGLLQRRVRGVIPYLG